MKFFFFPRKACWLVTLFVTISISVSAHKTGGSPDADINGPHCIPLSGQQSYTASINLPTDCITNVYWVTRGDLQIVESSNNGYSVNVESFNKTPSYNAMGYAKGRLIFYFEHTCECGRVDSVYVDIYKDFFETEHLIIGQKCIEAGDTVIFSYRPILTVNINEMIGCDTYFWDLSNVPIAATYCIIL